MYAGMYVGGYVCISLCTYIHTYLQYIQYIQYIHTYIQYIQYIQYMHTYIHPCMHAYIPTYIRSLGHAFNKCTDVFICRKAISDETPSQTLRNP